MPDKPTYEIDGAQFSTLEGFYDEISRAVIPGSRWGRNLDAFNDILRGGFGTPEGGFLLRWTNSALSRERLGYAETVRQLKLQLEICHVANRASIQQDLSDASKGHGPTVFDRLVDIFSAHMKGRREDSDGVELELV
jgi:RNAse (barnase) inhibitor barstar